MTHRSLCVELALQLFLRIVTPTCTRMLPALFFLQLSRMLVCTAMLQFRLPNLQKTMRKQSTVLCDSVTAICYSIVVYFIVLLIQIDVFNNAEHRSSTEKVQIYSYQTQIS